jgi:hypothetical protein
MSHYTEPDVRSGTLGFPRRLFVLPVTSFRLVAVPSLAGVISLSVVNGVLSAWTHDFNLKTAVGLSAFMVSYQCILWTFARLGALRAILLGIVAIWFLTIGIGFSTPSNALAEEPSNAFVIATFAVTGLVAFAASWLYVANQRSGGRRKGIRLQALTDRLAEALPKRTRDFRSPEGAQIWMEWRRAGFVLPACVGGILLVLIAPLCWYLRNDAGSTLRILLAILVMPPLFALPVGKGLSKPDFWSTELGLPPFLAVRPLSERQFISIKLKVAALSSGVTWLISLGFVVVWFAFVAKLDAVRRVFSALESFYKGTAYLFIALLFVALMLVTWRFLIGGLWIGVSGSRKLFGLSALPYAFTPIFIGFLLFFLMRRGSLVDWALANVKSYFPTAVLVLAAAAVVKLSVAFALRHKIGIANFMVWIAGTCVFVALALMLSKGMGALMPSFASQIRNVLVLVALLLMPLAGLGLATSLFGKNRHR